MRDIPVTGELERLARHLVAPGKGILAADESTPTLEKRFQALGIPSTVEHRRAYRQMLFTTPGVEEFISGVILFEETLHHAADDGTPLPAVLDRRGIVPGIKVDRGARPLAGSPGELVTEGLDGLRERLREYQRLGARFAKWRAVVTVGPGLPTRACLIANAEAMGRYAALCQEAGFVPIVEPEVLMDGDHTLERSAEVTEETLHLVLAALRRHRVALEGLLLKPNMVVPGTRSPRPASVPEVAEATLRCLRRVVPPAVPGIVFLSGGQSEALATAHLNAMNVSPLRGPWELSFSFARALQASAMKAWGGDPARVAAGQRAFAHRARCNSAARQGRYAPELERAVAAAGEG